MAFNENINLFQTTDRNSADTFNTPIEKIIENTKHNKEQLELLDLKIDSVNDKFNDYTRTEELNELLSHGIKGDRGEKGDKGDKGEDGTVAFDDLTDAQKAQLKGDKGEKGEDGSNGLDGTNGRDGINGKDGLTTAITVNGNTYNHQNGNITLPDYPTTLPSSDVHAWAKAATKPTYTAAEVGAIPISASCNKNWNWSGQGGQPTWIWGGNDASNMYVYNPSNFSVANSTKLGGVTLVQLREEIKQSGGDFMGKTLIVTGNTTIASGQAFTYTNSKGGLARLVLGNSRTFSVIADGVTIASGTSDDIGVRLGELFCEVYVPFSNTFVVNNTSQYASTIRCHLYINK